ncbi:MAG: toprim domain-containing protein [Candidatus Competibacter denitrificans]
MSGDLDELKRQVDIHDLAERLGLERPDPRGNYRSPHHADRSPSLQVGGRKYPDGFYDHSSGSGGDCIDLVKYVLGLGTADAIRWLRDQYGIPAPQSALEPSRPATLVEHIAAQSLQDTAPAAAYLQTRGILPSVIARAIAAKAVGFNHWTSPSKPPGSYGHGGPATAFLVRTFNPGSLVAVDLRYHDPALNGGQKTSGQGEKKGHPWTSYLKSVQRAHTVVMVESPINALSAESAFEAREWQGWAAVALRGINNAESIDIRPYQGKRVILCLDNDAPDAKGHRPGLEAAWTLHTRLTAQRIAAHFVDQAEWDCNDLNDFLQKAGPEETAKALEKLQMWAIPGVSGRVEPGKKRVFLPPNDFAAYGFFRVREDFTSWFSQEPDASGESKPTWKDLAGFRVADIARINIASAEATLNGTQDHKPTERFAVSAQTPYHQNELLRLVVPYNQINNLEWWKNFGPVWMSPQFMRLLNVWGRAKSLGERDAVNFVGLCWRNGQLHVNEGADTYFSDPKQQCPYHNLTFPSGPVLDAVPVIRAYAATFQDHAALLILVWALGAHLKAVLSYWPHLALEADKGKGKTTLCTRLATSLGCTIFGGDMLDTAFRQMTSVSHTSHPVFWEEISTRKQDSINRAVSVLQECYKHSLLTRTSDMTEFLKCAPVLLMGETVEEPTKSVIGKCVRVTLEKQGPMLPLDLPVFPVRQWLEYLAALEPKAIRRLHEQALLFCQARCSADHNDDSAKRMVENYAGVLTAWRLLQDFAGLTLGEIPLEGVLLKAMNGHIAGTVASRQPWVWVVEVVLKEIISHAYPFPYRFGEAKGEEVFFLRASDMVHHLKTKPGLRAIWDGIPVKGHQAIKRQMKNAGVVVDDDCFPTIEGHRTAHMLALSVAKLAEYGLYPEAPATK